MNTSYTQEELRRRPSHEQGLGLIWVLFSQNKWAETTGCHCGEKEPWLLPYVIVSTKQIKHRNRAETTKEVEENMREYKWMWGKQRFLS